MITFASPSTLYDIRPGHTGFTEEWGRIKVIESKDQEIEDLKRMVRLLRAEAIQAGAAGK